MYCGRWPCAPCWYRYYSTSGPDPRWQGRDSQDCHDSGYYWDATCQPSCEANAAAEEYERAASLAAELEALEGREAELAEGEAEGEASYARAAERQAALLGEQRSLWADQVGEARRCLAAREEVAAREATARESLLKAQEERLGE